jgi:transglutaminase-like putative cysteine protease
MRWFPNWRGPDPELAGWHLSAARLSWLCTSLALVVAPHALRMPFWITALFALMCFWRLWRVHHGDDRSSHGWWVVLLALAILPGIYASFGTVTGREAGVAMLTLLAGIKLLETRGLRDAYVLNFLGFFLIITGFLFDQSLLTGIYMIGVVVVMTATLLSLGISPGPSSSMSIAPHLHRAGVLVAQAVPLMLVLFLLFPRIPGPIWGLPKDAHAAVTGLSDDMSPGSISSLTQSDAVAFRVRFDNKAPPVSKLYWRGPVLDRTDGRRWTRGERSVHPSPVRLAQRDQPIDYEVTIEAHGKRWLFALDMPAQTPANSGYTRQLELRTRRDVRERRTYRMRSYLNYTLEPDRARTSSSTLELPPGRHLRARKLALGWRRELRNPDAVVLRALKWFQTQGFVYSLSPPLMLGDPVDEFLFGSRQGFCEHYASSFVVMMRAAGIPARVVTGYLGGEFNPLSGHMVVRQRDAHAWAEVWLDNRGWMRVDPTSVVSPTRIDQGIDAAIPPTLGPLALGLTPSGEVANALRHLRQAIDAVQTRWNSWVLGYGPNKQRRFLSGLGFGDSGYSAMIITLTLAMAILLSIIALWMLRRRSKPDLLRTTYEAFCRKLARRGLARDIHEGPWDYAHRTTAQRPDLGNAIHAITHNYVNLRYAKVSGNSAEKVAQLKQQIAQFQP